MTTNIDEFVNQVVDLAKQVLIESKALAEVINAEDAEERFPDLARSAAMATSQLIDVVNVARLDNHAQQEELLQATREARDCLLELCRVCKAAISNPYDFLTTQKLQNCRKGIVCRLFSSYVFNICVLWSRLYCNDQVACDAAPSPVLSLYCFSYC